MGEGEPIPGLWAWAAILSVGIGVLSTLWLFFRPSSLRHFPGPRPTLILGNLREIMKNGTVACMTAWEQQFGPVFKYRMGQSEFLVVLDPELVRDILVRNYKCFKERPQLTSTSPSKYGIIFSRGKYWLAARGAVMPPFHSEQLLDGYVGLMSRCIHSLSSKLSRLAQGESADITAMLQSMTLDVFCQVAFGESVEASGQAESTKLLEAVTVLAELFGKLSLSSFVRLFLGSAAGRASHCVMSRVPGTLENQLRRSVRYREQVGESLRKARQAVLAAQARGVLAKGTAGHQDLLTQLLRGRDAAKNAEYLTGANVSAIVAEFFVAGSETTTNLVSFAIFLLSTHPEAESKLTHEVRSLLPARGPPTTVKELEPYAYTLMVVKETLRLYPTASSLFREATTAVELGGRMVPRGTIIVVPLIPLHHNAKYFPDPEAFVPERFDPESSEGKAVNLMAYLPFGGGPRMCVGPKFALQEACLALVLLYARHTFALAGSLEGLKGKDAMAALQMDDNVLVRPKDGILVRVEAAE